MSAATLDPGGVLNTRPRVFRTAAFRLVKTVGFPLFTPWRDILVSTTIFFSGLYHAACLLACPPASYAHCWVCTWSSLLACWLGFSQVGLEPSVLTHWVTATNFLGLRLIPRSRAYLGAITTESGESGNIGSHNGAKILATVPPRVPEGRNRPMTTVPDVCSPMATASLRRLHQSSLRGLSLRP